MRCTVVFAAPGRVYRFCLELPAGAPLAAALAAARRCAAREGVADAIPWEGPAGVFGELRARQAACADGDRIELYRPLGADPRARRRERVQRERGRRRAPGGRGGPGGGG